MPTAQLTRQTRWWLNGVGVGVWVSGAAWLWLHYVRPHSGEFGLEPNPFEPGWLKVHGAFAFLSVWTLGLMSGLHVIRAWRMRRHRWSGGGLLATLLFLTLTGYLLYYVGAAVPRAWLSRAHWMLGVCLVGIYLLHRLLKTRSR